MNTILTVSRTALCFEDNFNLLFTSGFWLFFLFSNKI